MSRSILFIINPIAGVRPKDEIPELIHEVFQPAEDYDLDIRFTEYGGHASVLAQEAVRKGIDTVVAIGGDGTINETGRSLVGTPVKFGIVPMGSGNGLARHIQLPLNISHALECIRDGHSEAFDYGTVNDHIFFCTAGVGIDAQVSAKFAESGKRGPITYLRSFIELLSDYQPSTYEIYTDDGEVKEQAFLVAIGNASQWGNNAFITPQASMQDGLLDITLVKPCPLIEVPHMAMQLFTKQLYSNPHVLSFRSSHIRIVMPQPDVVHVDGEPIRLDGVLDIKTHIGQLNVITPLQPTNVVQDTIQFAFEDIHYSIQENLKRGLKQIEEINKPVLKAAETTVNSVAKAAETTVTSMAKAAETTVTSVAKAAETTVSSVAKVAENMVVKNPLFRKRPEMTESEEPMEEP